MAVYKSKDVEYMSKLKKAVLKGMKGRTPEEKTYTWEYVRKQVTLDDLHQYAVSELGKIVRFPTDNYNAKIITVFLRPPTKEEIEILYRMLEAAKIPKDDVYITYYYKTSVETESEKSVLEKILNAEISIIGPKLILSFGFPFHNQSHVVTDFKNSKLLITYDMQYVFQNDTMVSVGDRKRALWNDFKQLIQYYKM